MKNIYIPRSLPEKHNEPIPHFHGFVLTTNSHQKRMF